MQIPVAQGLIVYGLQLHNRVFCLKVHSHLTVTYFFVYFVTSLCILWYSCYTKLHKEVTKLHQNFIHSNSK